MCFDSFDKFSESDFSVKTDFSFFWFLTFHFYRNIWPDMISKQTDFQACKGVRHFLEAWKSGYLDFYQIILMEDKEEEKKEQKKEDEKASEKDAPKVFSLCWVSNSYILIS